MSIRPVPKSRADYRETGAAHVPAAGEMAVKFEPLVALARFVDGVASPFELECLRGRVSAFLGCHGAVPLETCLRLPKTMTGWRKSRRNGWLMKAAELVDAEGGTTGSQKLEAEWNTFISRGPWQAWRDDSEPPVGAPPLAEALFWATRFNRSESLSAKQIERIAGHIFVEKCR